MLLESQVSQLTTFYNESLIIDLYVSREKGSLVAIIIISFITYDIFRMQLFLFINLLKQH